MLGVFCLSVLASSVPAGPPADAPAVAERAEVLLAARCQSCHGLDKQKGGLRLDSRDALLAGGESGPAVVPGKPGESRLLQSVRHADGVSAMPPKESLSQADIDLLDRWVRGGAAWPAARAVTAARGDAWTDPANPIRRLFNGERLDLWSLKRPVDPPPPAVTDTGWSRTPIDRFVLAKLEAAGLRPSAPADRRTLIRRLTFDLTGLPPTPEDVQAYLADTRPDADDRLIDRLLASPRYGEAWGRHWLDLVRYADTNGFERDEFRPQMWRYRDYVVRSLNSDKPFDRFITEQLAGDELAGGNAKTPADVDALIATGFLRLAPFDSTRAIFGEDAKGRDELMADLTNTTGSAFLGLTMACCNCHDHKYDPLSQEDHFRLRAFFAAVKFKDYPLGADGERVEGVGEGGAVPPTRLFFQGDATEPRQEVPPGFPSVLDPKPAAVTPPRRGSTGRRLALAKWVTDPANPLAARVSVNRVWQHHFGAGLVGTPDDFGFSGARPTHPELLDWLAGEFVRSGWSLKHLHRLIARSAVYRQASVVTDAGTAADPDNILLWRQNVRRLPAEAVRDAVLAVSGRLRPDVGGPPRWPPTADEVLRAQPGILEVMDAKDDRAAKRLQGWYADPAEACDVRSLYLVQKRTVPLPLLTAFDQPDPTSTCGRRDVTTVTPQALALLNNPDVVRLAGAFADRVAREAGGAADAQIGRAVRLAFGRDATAGERAAALALMRRIDAPAAGPKPSRRALAEVCRGLLNTNEFIYVD